MSRADWIVRHLPEMTTGLRPALHAHLIHRDGIPYVGIELTGGLGALTHGSRIVAGRISAGSGSPG
ncbi:hypothetical protein [Streptomyces justiciae]|uniref:hypothetical protein n=1 Tax=Streptomyces justiciae TaxID=2780140 RepID=UPI00211950AC|nr:hypothetical protein [Streptomyces justiciae]MCW8378245.1 hypothetical protein [Streptomyces justiciae]